MNSNNKNSKTEQLLDMIHHADHIVAFTGAGISTESGIPDFRSPDGLWAKMEPIMYNDFISSEETRLEDWRRRFIQVEEFNMARPNEGHMALVRLSERKKLVCTITQNIDGLHQRSGLDPDHVIEIHGNGTFATCLDCDAEMSLRQAQTHINSTGKSPRCPKCGGLVKTAIINFGQAMPEDAMMRAMHQAADCDLFIVMGSSLVVYPAAGLPQIAKQNGAKLVILNRDPTPMDHLADLCIHDEIGPIMEHVV
ncbi:Sir2 family NAD-dependent protein deacetylase [uncultured Cohaesibacter sp.]|uniref:SIR2 family NAD-dependent protein deacylase n=1 Tax=uncultured Cohaesibacter sp. TaxID=1002546 RepID=UPI00292E4FD9|nr:Sir2 family NAD-dependent protein deacetylase [uncultured Cohaesibacter sp.]